VRWTKEELDKLIQTYPISTKSELLKEFPGRSYNSIISKSRVLKLRKDKKLVEKVRRECLSIGWKLSEGKKGKWLAPRVERVCQYCGKHFKVPKHMLRWNQGKYCSFECARAAHSKSLKRQNKLTQPMSSKETRTKAVHTRKARHEVEVEETIKMLKNQGFKCVNVSWNESFKPRPDIIAFKDNKIYAVEVDCGGYANFDKYAVPHPYDDVIWVLVRMRKKKHLPKGVNIFYKAPLWSK
jgi:hypothetical protein